MELAVVPDGRAVGDTTTTLLIWCCASKPSIIG